MNALTALNTNATLTMSSREIAELPTTFADELHLAACSASAREAYYITIFGGGMRSLGMGFLSIFRAFRRQPFDRRPPRDIGPAYLAGTDRVDSYLQIQML